MPNQAEIKAFFSGRVEKDAQDAFDRELGRINMKVAGWGLPVILLIELFNIIFVLFFTRRGLDSPNNRLYFSLYTSLFTVTVLAHGFWLWLKRNPERRGKYAVTAAPVYAVFLSLWGMGISLMDSRGREGTSDVMLYVMIGLAILLYIRPWQSLLIYGGCYFIFMIAFPLVADPTIDKRGVCINTSIYIIFILCIAFFHFHNKREDFLNRRIISMQNDQIRQINEKLNHLVITDTLSDLYNRRFLDALLPDKWQQQIEKRGTAAIFMLDIDDFKRYNDLLGHQAGDVCLRQIAHVMKHTLKQPDDFLIRYGGEEFSAVRFGCSRREALELAEQLRIQVEQLGIVYDGPEGTGRITVSIGVCYGILEPSDTVESYLHRADKALYAAKRAGKNRVEEWCRAVPLKQ